MLRNNLTEITKYKTCSYNVFYIIDGGVLSRGSTETEQFSGNWEALENGSIRVPTSPITYIDLTLNEDGNLVCDNPQVVFVLLP